MVGAQRAFGDKFSCLGISDTRPSASLKQRAGEHDARGRSSLSRAQPSLRTLQGRAHFKPGRAAGAGAMLSTEARPLLAFQSFPSRHSTGILQGVRGPRGVATRPPREQAAHGHCPPGGQHRLSGWFGASAAGEGPTPSARASPRHRGRAGSMRRAPGHTLPDRPTGCKTASCVTLSQGSTHSHTRDEQSWGAGRAWRELGPERSRLCCLKREAPPWLVQPTD